jgi:hypothetical protein
MPAAQDGGDHPGRAMHHEAIPRLSDAVTPPLVLGTAALTHAAMQGADFDDLVARVEASAPNFAAHLHDLALANQLAFRRAEGLDLLDRALEESVLYRIRGRTGGLRVLALMTPGDLMTNTPLDFITNHLDIRLDLLFLLPDRPLPDAIPDHEIAFIASSEPDTTEARRLAALFAAWPRPILNDPSLLPRLARDALPPLLAGHPGIVSPPSIAVGRARLDAVASGAEPSAALLPGHDGPVLVRPLGSHAGTGLKKIANASELQSYLLFSFARDYAITAFVDYRSLDGMFRKYRIAFIDRAPFLCHMAVSNNWMIHYLNAGMTESAAKRDDEARAMAEFESGFARRHADAFAALHAVLGFDFYSIDCAETPNGQLLLFEADTAAIIHLMDPPDLFPYKHPQMRHVFAAFEAMLRRRVAAACDQASALAI